MWAQTGGAFTVTPPTIPRPTTAPPHASAGVDYVGISREEMALRLQQAYALIDTYELRHRQQQTSTPQESQLRDTQGDEALENGRSAGSVPPQPLYGQIVPSDFRMRVGVPPEMEDGGRAGHPSQLWRRQVEVEGEEEGQGEVTSGYTGAAATAVWSDQRVLASATLPAEEKCEVLIQALGQCQIAWFEEQQRSRRAELLNHALLSEVHAVQEANREKDRSLARMRDEIAARDDQIRDLERQLEQAQRERDSQRSLPRPGIKRGRFTMSRTATHECGNCRQAFTSAEDALSSLCQYHPKAASELHARTAQAFSSSASQHRYWPCCRQFGSKAPPCHCGQHNLRSLS
ncbi:uncharacterized protein LOC143295108 [Babylonia areolata]|uniref:uncharacterized protein LOC143295108 n=1 Tax=Babylonia areolata TaxID=304850 RepID=UPI003FD17D04